MSVRAWVRVFNNKACRLVPTELCYMHVDLCVQRTGDLRMCGSQTDWNVARRLRFLERSFYVLRGIWYLV